MDPLREARALLVLRALPGVGDRGMGRILERFGSGAAALAAPAVRFREVAPAKAVEARADADLNLRAREALERCRELSVTVVPVGAPEYPRRLLDLHAPPVVLFLRGRATLLDGPAVAVVGSRKSTAYGRRVADEVVRALVSRGVTVLSGLALGIDAAAHRSALAGGGGTVAVLGNGPDVGHPPSNRALFQRIVRDGLVVSEHEPGEQPHAHHFPRRNRILAALSDAVVVVEAARRSGALITTDLALELGREILAVPGSIYSRGSEGTNRLIRLGAHPVLEAGDVLDVLGLAGGPPARAPMPPAELGGDVTRLWEALEAVPRAVDDLAAASGLNAGRTLAALSALEMGGWARKEAGMRFARKAS